MHCRSCHDDCWFVRGPTTDCRSFDNFRAPICSMNDYWVFSSIITGDLGPKIGYYSMDNGFAVIIFCY